MGSRYKSKIDYGVQLEFEVAVGFWSMKVSQEPKVVGLSQGSVF
jgi:hypothetical protein